MHMTSIMVKTVRYILSIEIHCTLTGRLRGTPLPANRLKSNVSLWSWASLLESVVQVSPSSLDVVWIQAMLFGRGFVPVVHLHVDVTLSHWVLAERQTVFVSQLSPIFLSETDKNGKRSLYFKVLFLQLYDNVVAKLVFEMCNMSSRVEVADWTETVEIEI